MLTNRRNFIKQTVSAASTGLLLAKEGGAMEQCTSIETDPDIRVLFSGMLLYRFYPPSPTGPYTHCDVCPLDLSDSYKHRFSVIVKAREGTEAPYTLWRYFGKPDDRLTLSVSVGGSPRVGVSKYTPTAGDFVRSSPGNNPKDWRWTLRIDEFLQRETKPDYQTGKLRHRFQLTNGLFYSAIKTNPARTMVTCNAEHETPRDLYSVTSVVGSNICLEEGGMAVLSGVSSERIAMPKRSDANMKYDIFVEFDPRVPVLPASTQDTPSHFHKYYDVMKTPKPRRRYNVLYRDVRTGRQSLTPMSTPDVPCMGLEG